MRGDRQERIRTLLKVLHDEAEELLITNEVWSSYGWQDEDTPDAEYAGIAMWELNPPFEHDWGFLLEGRAPKDPPTKRQEILMGSGEDLLAAMTFARRSLGMALCFSFVSDPDAIGGNEEFWQEYATTLMWLNIASDRLRDFFLMARFSQTTEQYHEQYHTEHNTYRVPYSEPFKVQVDNSSASNQKKLLDELSQLADQLQQHRKDRNDRVHKLATITAQRNIDLLREQRRVAAPAKNQVGPVFRDEALAPATDVLKLWFRRLMKAASLVFEFEYFDRIKN